MFTKFKSQIYKTQNLDVKYLELQKYKSNNAAKCWESDL